MKKFFICLMLFFVVIGCRSSAPKHIDAPTTDVASQGGSANANVEASLPKGAYIITDSTKRELAAKNLGMLRAGEVIESSVILANGTSKPIVILDTKGSCGCVGLVPNLKPFAPGGVSEIKFSYNTKGKNGKQFDVITIITSVGEFIVELNADVTK